MVYHDATGVFNWCVSLHLALEVVLTRCFRQTVCGLWSKYGITRTQGTRPRLSAESHNSNAPSQWDATRCHLRRIRSSTSHKSRLPAHNDGEFFRRPL